MQCQLNAEVTTIHLDGSCTDLLLFFIYLPKNLWGLPFITGRMLFPSPN